MQEEEVKSEEQAERELSLIDQEIKEFEGKKTSKKY
jgi:hypothetical protein